MITKHIIFPNLYQDSVALMRLSARLNQLDGINKASVVMGTPANIERLFDAGFVDIKSQPNDLIVAVSGEENSCIQAVNIAEQELTAPPIKNIDNNVSISLSSVVESVKLHPKMNLALISVPGEFAATEAEKALRLGLNVMLFSDNVSLEEEKYIKQLAREKNLLVMGPDCGTAIINGTPLGFANKVRQGKIGVIGASGTGLQEVTCQIHHLGGGVSQVIGTGGNDLNSEIGGISMIDAMQLLAEDPNTHIIVLVSKPPAAKVAEAVLYQARLLNKPVVIHFIGEWAEQHQEQCYFANSLAHTAQIAVALCKNEQIPTEEIIVKKLASKGGSKYIRGVFSGGTFCYEAQNILSKYGLEIYSNTPIFTAQSLKNVWKSEGHTILDLGDDLFTKGRPHPMIEPSLRNQRICIEAEDPNTAVILFDIVLGYGATTNPLEGLEKILEKSSQNRPHFITHICGTENDPQNRFEIEHKLISWGVTVAKNNAEAAHLAANFIISN